MAWSYTIVVPSPQVVGTGIAGMAAGPMGHVAVTTTQTGANGNCAAGGVVLDASGAATDVPAEVVKLAGACSANISPIALDPGDHLLHAYVKGHLPGPESSGWAAGAVSEKVSGDMINGPVLFPDFLGADAAGNVFVETMIFPLPTEMVDFGLGPVSGTVMLHYGPSGTLAADDLPTVATGGSVAVGALGHLYYATPVTGTLDDGCGSVGAAGVASTVLTQRSAAGACVWSKALPASTRFALDPAEDVLLATTFSGTVSFGGAPLTSMGTSDLAIAKLDPTGAFVWSKSFGASGATVSGVTGLGATNAGGLALAAGLTGAVDFGCGAVSASSSASTVLASFDATGTVVYSRAVELLGGISHYGPVVDGLGGISYAAQVTYTSCACTTNADCTGGDTCTGGECGPTCFSSNNSGDIFVSRFAP